MFKRLLIAAVTSAFTVTGAAASTFNEIYVESFGFRPGATGDITESNAIGAVGPRQKIGVAGRIKNQMDIWDFQPTTKFSVRLSDVFDDDGVEGFQGNTQATFDLVNTMTNTVVASQFLTPNLSAGLLLFSGGPGSYSVEITGVKNAFASLYDFEITTVPVPASLPLLLAGVGAIAVARRRSSC